MAKRKIMMGQREEDYAKERMRAEETAGVSGGTGEYGGMTAERDAQGEMSREFGQALSDFTFDMACGGAIRHLAGLGLTAKEVRARLSFPVSYERVRQAYTKYLLDTGVLLREHPESRCAAVQKTYIYVQEEGKYGKKSFRRVEKEPGPEDGKRIYAACDFGKLRMPDGLAALGLDVKQQEYLEGICWGTQTMYHLMNDRMRGIVETLAGHGHAGAATASAGREQAEGVVRIL